MKLNEIKSTFKKILLRDLSDIEVNITDLSRIDFYKNKIRNNEDILPLQLINLNGNFYLQDGNHRLQAFRDEHINKVSVQMLNATFINGEIKLL